MFIAGLVVGRMRFFERIQNRRKNNLILFADFTLLTFTLNFVVDLFPPFDIRSLWMTGGESLSPSALVVMALNDITTVMFSGALMMGFIILYQTKWLGRWLDGLSPYGRMGLTNYEMQNVIGCLLFSAWSFGSTFGNQSTTTVFVMGLVLYTLQLVFSRYWVKYFLYGPLEWIWRSATYLKWQPLRKKETS
jgi:uncharacterized protein